MTGMPDVHRLQLTADYDGWNERPVSTVASLDIEHAGLTVGVDIAPHVNGYQITVRIPPFTQAGRGLPVTSGLTVVWLGIVSHRLGEGYPERLIDALVTSYIDGWLG